ncbi:phytase [Tenacibaculum sp. C7A-26P2]|uniref:phytase n=1 Tax=Tenacibaculum sp. C7A-26P2 TaxID=3447504 RepID=UPI003F871841
MKIFKVQILVTFIILTTYNCKKTNHTKKVLPDIRTEKTLNDTDDPAIWINKTNAENSIIFGTDKNANGAIYAFDLEGKIITNKCIRNIKRPNNIDVAYNFKLNDSISKDIIAFTERELNQIRIFTVPDMKSIDNGGFKVFRDERKPGYNLPMGIALYKSFGNKKLYAIISRKNGPKEKYLYQYEIYAENGSVKHKLVRKFGKFSGKKEIESIAVDEELGYVYYSDEKHGVRKYHADPEKGNKEIAVFGGELFKEDIEGIAIAKMNNKNGYIIISNQQQNSFNIFDRKTNTFIKKIDLTTTRTDGCEITTTPLGDKFPNGLFVAMNDDKDFYFYDLKKLIP